MIFSNGLVDGRSRLVDGGLPDAGALSPDYTGSGMRNSRLASSSSSPLIRRVCQSPHAPQSSRLGSASVSAPQLLHLHADCGRLDVQPRMFGDGADRRQGVGIGEQRGFDAGERADAQQDAFDPVGAML
jgi:hypothetical protein